MSETKILIYKQLGINFDVAILSLKKAITNQKPIKISNRGFEDGVKYLTIGKNMLAGTKHFGFWNLREDCYSSFQNILTPEYDNKFDPFVSLSNCPIAAGNSGAPVLNSRRELVGIIRGHIANNLYETAHQHLIDHKFINVEENLFVSAASNIVCVPNFFSSDSTLPKGCDAAGAERIDTTPEKKAQLFARFASKLPKVSDTGRYELASNPFSGYRTTFVFIPNCIDSKNITTQLNIKTISSTAISPVISERFEITDKMSSPQKIFLVLKETLDPTQMEFEARSKIDGPTYSTGQISICR